MTTLHTRRQHPWIGFVIACALVGAWTVTGRAQARDRDSGQVERSTQTLRLDPGGLLDLSNVSGDITVGGGSGREVILEIVKRASRRNNRTSLSAVKRASRRNNRTSLSAVEIDIDARSSRIEVRTRYPRNTRRTRISVSYDVTVPRDTRVFLRSVSGDIVLSNIDGEARIETVSGEVVVRRVTQLVRAKSVSGGVTLADIATDDQLEAATVSGDLEAHDISGRRLRLNTVSGDIDLRGVAFSRTDIDTVSGDIEFEGDLAVDGRYSFNAHSGDVRLILSDEVGFELEASSFSGSVRSDLPVVLDGFDSGTTGRRRNRNVVGTYGDGSALLEISTFSGDIVITR